MWSIPATIRRQIKNSVPRINAMSLIDAKRRSSRMFFLYIFSLAFAVFAAWAYGRSTDRVIAETNLETEKLKQENLKLGSDLDEEKGKVAGLQKAAAEAETKLSEQQGKTAKLEKAASEAQTALEEQKGKTATLEKAASDAQRDLAEQKGRTAKLEEDAANAKKELAKAELALETERTARLQLEAFNTPREIVSPFVMVDTLKSFAGTDVIIEHAPDSDSRNLAGNLSWILGEARWIVVENRETELYPNITVRAPFIMYESRASEAAVALMKELGANAIEATGAPTSRRKDTVIVEIGRKEARYLAEKRRAEIYRDFIFREPKNPEYEPLPQSAVFTHFDVEQRTRFAEVIGRFSKDGGRPMVQIRCPAGNEEACSLAKDIGLLVRGANWQLQDDAVIRDPDFPSIARDVGNTFPASGVRAVVVARWKEEKYLPSWVLFGALKAAGLTVERTTDLFAPDAPLLVVVYPKK